MILPSIRQRGHCGSYHNGLLPPKPSHSHQGYWLNEFNYMIIRNILQPTRTLGWSFSLAIISPKYLPISTGTVNVNETLNET